jgi:cellulose synthase/poly-beta-1,6-N-acetylglucosamine synthase-like glycosyltransferase
MADFFWAEILFWIAIGCVAFAYVGYSLSIILIGLFVRRKLKRADIEPTITFLITAYNEEKNLAAKIEGTLALDYPPEKLEIIVASDGSTDRTDEIAHSFAARGVRLVRVEGRVGKTETQNQAVRQARHDIIIFSDATTQYEKQALRKIVRNFADPEVGAVSGRYEYFNPTGAAIGVGSVLFWKYENFIKRTQTRIHTITGCCGCIYSVRRAAYQPLPAEIISDLCEPLAVLSQGYRIVFEPDAIAFEETTEKTSEEFNMRVRVAVRGMRGLLFMKKLFNPFKFGFVSYQLFGHKVMRWMVPVFALIAFAANTFLLDGTFYQVTFALQSAFYLLAALGYLGTRWNFRLLPMSVPLFVVTVNLAMLTAMWRVMKGVRAVTWETVRR